MTQCQSAPGAGQSHCGVLSCRSATAERRLSRRPASGLRPGPGPCKWGGRRWGSGPRSCGVRGVQRRHAERGRLLCGAGPRRAAGRAPTGLPGP